MNSPTKKLIILGVLGCLAIGAGDALVELALRNPSYIPNKAKKLFNRYYFQKDQLLIQFSKECSQYDKELFYTLKPGECEFSSRYFDTKVSVNSLGVRDDESSLVKPEIIVIGDSEAMGWGVEKEETFADIIEKKTGCKVLNLGESSYGTVRELKILERADISNLKVLIVQWNNNDLYENKSFQLNNNHLKIRGENEYLELQKNSVINNYPGKPFIWLFGKILDQIKKEKNIPRTNDIHEKYFFNALKHSPIPLDKYVVIVLGLERWGVMRPNVGSKTFYLPLPEVGEYRLPVDYHLNTKGHQLVADSILKILPSATTQ
ncbi:MAG: hypothetical protein ACQ9MH_12585 [Nitrospinales bacterium]